MDTQHLLFLIFLSSHIYFGISEDTLSAVLTVEPNISTVFRGEAVHLKCKIEGQIDDQGWYLWQKSHAGHFVTHKSWDAENTLSMFYVTESDSGIYRCMAQQRYSSQTLYSNSISLTVLGLPEAKLLVNPESHVFTGDTVTLKCVIDSLSGWTYKWYRSADVVSETEENTFTIRAAAYSDQGQYWCWGKRTDRPTASTSSGSIYLVVKDLPTVRITFLEPRSTVFPGETVTLKCEIATLNSWTYKWYKDLSPDPVLESKGNTFTISSAAESDEGQYWCQGERTGRPTTSEKSRSVAVKVNESPAEPKFSLLGPVPLLTGQSISLRCELESDGWHFHYYKTTTGSQPVSVSGINVYSISSVRVSDGGQYWCRAGRGDPVYYTQYSNAVWVNVTERPKSVVTLQSNWTQVFNGEVVTLRCDIQTKASHEWEYSWYINGHSVHGNHQLYVLTVNHVNKKDRYTCRGRQIGDRLESDSSEALTLDMLAERPQAVLTGPPQSWLTEGDSVTLSCVVNTGAATGWKFLWYKTAPYRSDLPHITSKNTDYYLQLLSDSSRGAEGSYTLSPAALRHTGVYVCRAERGETAYQTEFSQPLPLFITGLSSASMVIRPSRSQHFTANRLSISCEVQGNTTAWALRWFTKKPETPNCPSSWKPTLRPGCTTEHLSTLDSGAYWCQSDTNEKSQAVNITVHSGAIIIESPVHPVREGHPLSLRCLYRTDPPDFSADFFKDRSPLKTRTGGEMTIAAISKADEGLYQCDNRHRGMSPDAWVLVKVSEHGSSTWIAVGVALVLVTLLILAIILVLLFHSKKSKGTHEAKETYAHKLQSSSQSSSRLNQQEYTHLDSGTDPIYATVNVQSGEQDQAESTDLTYAHFELKQITTEQKINNNSDEHMPSDVTYACVNVQAKKPRPKVEDESTNANVTYAVVNVKAKKLRTKVLTCLTCQGNMAGALKPAVTRQPNWPEVISGERITLTCELQGHTGIFYKWYKDGFFFGDGRELHFQPINQQDSGAYKCIARDKNERWTESDPYDIFVLVDLPKPTVTVVSQPSLPSGDTVTLRCDIAEGEGWDYTWERQFKLLPDKSKTITVSLPNVKVNYRCSGIRKGAANLQTEVDEVEISGSDLSKAKVTVLSPQPPFHSGDRVTLRCEVAQADSWDYGWEKDGKSVDGQESEHILVTLPGENGQYRCTGKKKSHPKWQFISGYVDIVDNGRGQSHLVLGVCSGILILLVLGFVMCFILKQKGCFSRPSKLDQGETNIHQDHSQQDGCHTYESISPTHHSPAGESTPAPKTVYTLLKPEQLINPEANEANDIALAQEETAA